MKNFQGGNIFFPSPNWRKTTKSQVTLDIIQHGLKLRTEDESVTNTPFDYPKAETERAIKGLKAFTKTSYSRSNS